MREDDENSNLQPPLHFTANKLIELDREDMLNIKPTMTTTAEKNKTTADDDECCCPPFHPPEYQQVDENGNKKNYKIVTWTDKTFVVDGTYCLFYIPLGFGKAVRRAISKIEHSKTQVPKEDFMILSNCHSPWWSDILVSTSKDQDVEGAKVAKISGSFVAKAYEGEYSNMGKWAKEVQELVVKVRQDMTSLEKECSDKNIIVQKQGEQHEKDTEKILFYYPTCPKCARKYGKNYVVIFARI